MGEQTSQTADPVDVAYEMLCQARSRWAPTIFERICWRETLMRLIEKHGFLEARRQIKQVYREVGTGFWPSEREFCARFGAAVRSREQPNDSVTVYNGSMAVWNAEFEGNFATAEALVDQVFAIEPDGSERALTEGERNDFMAGIEVARRKAKDVRNG